MLSTDIVVQTFAPPTVYGREPGVSSSLTKVSKAHKNSPDLASKPRTAPLTELASLNLLPVPPITTTPLTTAGGDLSCIATIWLVGSIDLIKGITSTIPSLPNLGQGAPVAASNAMSLLSLVAKNRLCAQT